jgi:predicted nucleotidyltransferase
MKIGLSEKNFKLVEELALKPLKSVDARGFVFGSRARGKHHPFSDLDILYRLKPDQ